MELQTRAPSVRKAYFSSHSLSFIVGDKAGIGCSWSHCISSQEAERVHLSISVCLWWVSGLPGTAPPISFTQTGSFHIRQTSLDMPVHTFLEVCLLCVFKFSQLDNYNELLLFHSTHPAWDLLYYIIQHLCIAWTPCFCSGLSPLQHEPDSYLPRFHLVASPWDWLENEKNCH